MSSLRLEAVQKLLNIHATYDYFPDWHEALEFNVDGIAVKAVAIHKWRYESIKVLEPFEVGGVEYGEGTQPPLFVLGISMLGRQTRLAECGLTVRDDCIRMAANTYLMHAAYLRLKPRIDIAQEEYLSEFRDQLKTLFDNNTKVQAVLDEKKKALRKQFRTGQIDQKTYQPALEELKSQASESNRAYSDLKYKVDRGLREIKMTMIRESGVPTLDFGERVPS